MRLHTHNEQQIVTQTEEVLLEDRLPIAEITKYLKSIICNLEALKYDIEEVFDPERHSKSSTKTFLTVLSKESKKFSSKTSFDWAPFSLK